MKIKRIKFIILSAIIVGLLSSSIFAIKRVAPSMSFIELSGGIAQPIGTYDRTVLTDFDFGSGLLDFDADEVYEDGINISVAYGKLVNRNWQMSAGFRYIQHDYITVLEKITGNIINILDYIEQPTYKQYDLDLNINYLPFDLKKESFSPYVGLSIATGFASATFKSADLKSESDATIAFRANFGAEVKVWKSPDTGSFLTLASINSFDIYGSGVRAKHLQIGGGIRFYSR